MFLCFIVSAFRCSVRAITAPRFLHLIPLFIVVLSLNRRIRLSFISTGDALHLAVVRFSFYIIFCQRDVRHSGETARASCALQSLIAGIRGRRSHRSAGSPDSRIIITADATLINPLTMERSRLERRAFTANAIANATLFRVLR